MKPLNDFDTFLLQDFWDVSKLSQSSTTEGNCNKISNDGSDRGPGDNGLIR